MEKSNISIILKLALLCLETSVQGNPDIAMELYNIQNTKSKPIKFYYVFLHVLLRKQMLGLPHMANLSLSQY